MRPISARPTPRAEKQSPAPSRLWKIPEVIPEANTSKHLGWAYISSSYKWELQNCKNRYWYSRFYTVDRCIEREREVLFKNWRSQPNHLPLSKWIPLEAPKILSSSRLRHHPQTWFNHFLSQSYLLLLGICLLASKNWCALIQYKAGHKNILEGHSSSSLPEWHRMMAFWNPPAP